MGDQTKSLSLSKWILFHTLGWVIGVIAAILLADPLEIIKLPFVGFGLSLGGGIALVQWMLWRRYIAIDFRWVWMGMAGLGSSFLLLDLCILAARALGSHYQLDGVPAAAAIGLAAVLGSLVTGRLQERMMKQVYPDAMGWTLSTVLGWTTAAVVVAVYVTITVQWHVERSVASGLASVVAIMSGGPIIGYFTGKKVIMLIK